MLISTATNGLRADEAEVPIQPAEVKLDRPVDFQRDIYPIFEANCIACHNLATKESDLVLESVAAALKGGFNGPAVVPGKPEDSYLYQLAARHEEPVMPPWPNDVQAQKLTPEQLGLLKQWILEGAKAGAGSAAASLNWQTIHDQLNAIYALDVNPAGRFVAAGRAGSVTVYDLLAPAQPRWLADPGIELSASRPLAHRDYVHAIAFHPTSDLLATAGYRVVNLWTRNLQDAVQASSAAADSVTATHTAAGRTIQVAGTTVTILNSESQQQVAVIAVPAEVTSACLSADAQRVATVSTDSIARIWNAADGAQISELTQDLQAARQLQARETDKAVRDARVGVVKNQITEAEKRVTEQQESLKKAEEALGKAKAAQEEAQKKLTDATSAAAAAKQAAEAGPDDQALKKQAEETAKAEQTASEAVTTADNELKSAEKGKQLAEQAIQRASGFVTEKQQLLAEVQQEQQQSAAAAEQARAQAGMSVTAKFVAFISDAGLLATLDQSGVVRLWKAADGAAVDVLPLPIKAETVAEISSAAQQLLIRHSDGSVVTASVFPEWQLAGKLGPRQDAESVFIDRVLSLAFSPDGSLLAAGGGDASRTGQVTLWNTAERTLVREIPDAHSDTVYGVEFSADGKRLATASADKFVKVFDVSTGQHLRSYEGHTHHVMDVSWKGDGTTLVSAGADNAIKVWDAETGEQARTISTYNKQVTSLEFLGLQDEFISASGDRRVFRHKAGDGKPVREFTGCPDYVYCTAASNDGQVIAAGCEDGILRIWNGNDGKEIVKFAPAEK